MEIYTVEVVVNGNMLRRYINSNEIEYVKKGDFNYGSIKKLLNKVMEDYGIKPNTYGKTPTVYAFYKMLYNSMDFNDTVIISSVRPFSWND